MMTTNQSIKMWAEDDRPREKMNLKGRNSLSNAELLAILIGSGTRSMSALEVAQNVLKLSGNNIDQLGKLSLDELKTVAGIGDAKAVTIAAALEIGRRRERNETKQSQAIKSASQAYNILKPYFMDLCHEEFRIIALNRSNKVIAVELISIGGANGTIADGKIIFKRLLELRASACILSHNHPSGTLAPSAQDLAITKNICSFSKLIEISILDHIICTDHGFYSFAENGDMP
jgi:DNA repair protein RadC